MAADASTGSRYGPFPTEVIAQAPDDRHTYHGNCHCGAVKFTATISPGLPKHLVVDCNCSLCARNGYLLVYPLRPDFAIFSGQDHLTGYQFNALRNTHFFCKTCGSSVYFDTHGHERLDFLGVNIRMLKDVDLEKLNLRYANGAKNIAGEYKVW